MKIATTILACVLGALPMTAMAQPHDDRNRPAPAPQRAFVPSHEMSTRYVQQQPRVEQHYVQQQPRVEQRYVQQQPRVEQSYVQSQRYAPRPIQPMPRYESRQVVTQYHPDVNVNASARPAWYWHGGVAWTPAVPYWGGGFWGDFSIGLPVATYQSYSVADDSPGAQLLANYQLQQGPCDQDNMVDIYGPDNSEMCAYPNNLVGPGQYQIDMSNLSLVSF